jgi:hypothetical protein
MVMVADSPIDVVGQLSGTCSVQESRQIPHTSSGLTVRGGVNMSSDRKGVVGVIGVVEAMVYDSGAWVSTRVYTWGDVVL